MKRPTEWPEHVRLSAMTDAFAVFPDEQDEDRIQVGRDYVLASQLDQVREERDTYRDDRRYGSVLRERDKLQARVEEAEKERASLHGELATMLGPRKPREGVTANDHWIAAVGALLIRVQELEGQAPSLMSPECQQEEQ